jgi:hypothetical protein
MTQATRTELSVAAVMLSAVFAILLLVSARAAAMHAQESGGAPVAAATANP